MLTRDQDIGAMRREGPLVRTLAILYDNIAPATQNITRLEDDLKIIYYLDKPFDLESIAFVAREADTVLVDDRIFARVAPVLDQRPWPLSRARKALDRKGACRADCAAQAMPRIPFPRTFSKPVVFVVSNDTHVQMLRLVAEQVPNHKFVAINRGEHADNTLANLGKPFLQYPKRSREQLGMLFVNRMERIAGKVANKVNGSITERILVAPIVKLRQWVEKRTYCDLDALDPSIVVLGMDWGMEERAICEWARHRGIPTVCIQEGPQDFNLPGLNQMQAADHVFVQGAITVQYLKRKAFFITGNPKLSDMPVVPLPEKPVVMINANFTYDIYEDWRDRWMAGAVRACQEVGVDFFVSRHPRDFGKYEGLPVLDSNAFSLHSQIAKSSVLVTRFSQVVYEAMLMGRSVVYYNPHGEDKKTLTGDRTGALLFAGNPDQLRVQLTKAISFGEELRSTRSGFLTIHCGPQDGQAVERCVVALSAVANGRIVATR